MNRLSYEPRLTYVEHRVSLSVNFRKISPSLFRCQTYLFRMPRFLTIWLLCVLAALAASGPAWSQGPAEPSTEAEPHAQALFVRALTEAYLGDHERAVLLLNNVLSTLPNEPSVFAALAESYSALGQQAEALYFAAQAVEYGRDEPSYFAALAELQEEANQPEAAMATYAALLALRPQDADALASLGRLQERSGQLEEALISYQRLIDAAGEAAALRLRMEALHTRLGHSDEALRMLELAAGLHWNEPMIQFRLGLAYRDAARTDDAIAVFERYLALERENVEGTLILAELYETRGDFDRAAALHSGLTNGSSSEELLRRAALLYERSKNEEASAAEARQILEGLADDEDASVDVLLMLGDLAFRAEDYGIAADVLGRAIEVDPRKQGAWEQAAAARLYAGNAEGAVELAEEGLILFPGSVGLFRTAAFSYAHLDRPRKGIAMVVEALEILEAEEPEALSARTRLLSLKGLLHDKLGERRLAFEAFEDGLSLEPESPLILNNYAYILSERDERLADALSMATRANELAENNPYFLDTLGWVYYKLGRLGEAAQSIERAIAADDNFALLYDHLGDVYNAQRRSVDARAAWNRALELDPENETIRTKLGGM